MSLINARLLDKLALGFTGGPGYLTTKVTLNSGKTARNAERSQPLYRYSAGYDRISRSDHDLIIAAYNAALGPLHTFLFRDRADYQLDDVVIGTAVGGVDETLQLVKPYTFGAETLNRIITKPVAGLVLTEDDVTLAHTVDLLTGIVTFTSTAGKVIRATGEFDVPVYFEEDKLDFSYENLVAHSTQITLTEDRWS